MQTKKKLPVRNATQGHANPRVCRPQRKVSENMQIAEKKATELITSSARKQRFAGVVTRKSRDLVSAKSLNNSYMLACDDTKDISLGYDAIDGSPADFKGCNDGAAQCVLETIFSPAFHLSKDVGGTIANGGFMKFCRSEDQEVHQNCGIDEQQVDMSCVDIETSYLTGGEKNNSSQISMTTVSKTPFSEMDVDINITSEHFKTQNSGVQIPPLETNGTDSNCAGDLAGAKLSSEVSAIYLAMQHSKLECVDEPSQDSMSTDVCVEVDDGEEIDDFDPYLFIKNLPELSSVVPTFRPMLLPKQTRSCPRTTLVLDLDETLVHSTLEHCDDADFTFPVNFNLKEHTVYVRCRPHLKDFMERIARLFEIIIFTASQSIYAEQLLNVLDPKRRIFRHRVYRESCVFVEGNYLKDLTILGRDLARVIIIDNSPQAFGFQVENGIPIESWFDDRSDQELILLLPFLESLVGAEDVRPLIAKKFNLREKIAAAAFPSLTFHNGVPFER